MVQWNIVKSDWVHSAPGLYKEHAPRDSTKDNLTGIFDSRLMLAEHVQASGLRSGRGMSLQTWLKTR